MIEADTVAHCGPTLIGEFARTLTMTDVVTGWTENHSIRNNASKWIVEGIEELQACFPFAMVIFDSDCGGEFINHEVAAWLQARDIEQTRSRPHQKNDQAHVESKNNHVVRKHAFYWRYDTPGGASAAQPAVAAGVAATELLHPDEEGRGSHHYRTGPPEADL